MRTVRVLRAAAVVGASTTVLALGQLPAAAATSDPYSATPYGYDVSYPQCPGTSVPNAPSGETYSFAIIGVGGGRPFTSNSCAGTETAAATADTSITNIAYYFNTGYAGAYGRDISSTCSGYVSTGSDDGVFVGIKGHALTRDEQAWEIGCSEALYAQANAPTPAPTMWWADIETGNSWSTNTGLNDFVIDGLSYQMQQVSTTGGAGIYSYTSAWTKIAGAGFTPIPAESGNWVAFKGDVLNGVDNGGNYVVQNGTSGGADTDLGY